MKRLSVVLLLVVLFGLLSVAVVSAQNKLEFFVHAPRGITAALRAQIAASGGRIQKEIRELGLVVVSTANPASLQALERTARVRVAPNIVVTNGDPRVELAPDTSATIGSDDTFFPILWGLDAINAPQAWAQGGTGSKTLVAVLDEGFNLGHPDMAGQYRVDIMRSFVPGEGVEYLLLDGFSHGGHVAGTIAALDNNFGVIGVAPHAKVVPVKVLSEVLGYGEFEWVVEGIKYAADVDADVVNMSLGAQLNACENPADALDIYNIISAATLYAYDRNTTVIASAGNNATNHDAWPTGPCLVNYPASAAWVFSISATAPIGWAKAPTDIINDPAGEIFMDNLASYSNSGRTRIDFAAPGGDFVYPGDEACTVTLANGVDLTRPCWVFDMVISTGSLRTTGYGYYWSAGTSMAAPHATGVAAIIITQTKEWAYSRPEYLRPDHIFAEMRRRADYVGSSTTREYGHGRVNPVFP